MRLPLGLIATIALSGIAFSGEDETRMLWDTGLLQKRPASKTPGSRPLGSISYRPASPAPGPSTPDDTVVGLTFWRLRKPLPLDDPNSRLLVLDEASGEEAELIPERIEADTPLKPGDRVRVSVEVPRTGYLYVMDREQYADGKLGAAQLIYPNFQTRSGDNMVSAGRTIEIPDRRDRINHFKLIQSRADHVGEVLEVFVTPKPLDELNTNSRKMPVVADEKLAGWEKKYGLKVERFELNGGAGKTWTEAERKAGENSTKMLTRDDALPQTLYRVKAPAGVPILLRVPLRIETH